MSITNPTYDLALAHGIEPGRSALVSHWVTCPECRQDFDLTDEDDAQEWFYGHDCEAP